MATVYSSNERKYLHRGYQSGQLIETKYNYVRRVTTIQWHSELRKLKNK